MPGPDHAGALAAMLERRSKGLTDKDAEELLEDGVLRGNDDARPGEVDGLVSGAVHSTANPSRPALH